MGIAGEVRRHAQTTTEEAVLLEASIDRAVTALRQLQQVRLKAQFVCWMPLESPTVGETVGRRTLPRLLTPLGRTG